MVRNHVQEYYVNQGMCADIVIHDKGQGKPHAHLLLTTRALDENGNWMFKQCKNYLRNEDGSKIIDPNTGRYKLGKSIKQTDWDDRENAEKWRKAWAEVYNRELERIGLEKRVTHMSFKRQGSDREPTVYMGAKAMALEKRGIPTDRGDRNREILMERERRRRENEHERILEQSYEQSR